MSDEFEELDDAAAKVLTTVSLVNYDVFDVPANAQITDKLALNDDSARANNSLLSDILDDHDLVDVFAAREELVKALHELLFSRVAYLGQTFESFQESFVEISRFKTAEY